LYLTDADTAIKQLFHFREVGADDSNTFSSAALFLFFFPYITLGTIVYGMAVPRYVSLVYVHCCTGDIDCFDMLFVRLLSVADCSSPLSWQERRLDDCLDICCTS
jgi:hypothetical protein